MPRCLWLTILVEFIPIFPLDLSDHPTLVEYAKQSTDVNGTTILDRSPPLQAFVTGMSVGSSIDALTGEFVASPVASMSNPLPAQLEAKFSVFFRCSRTVEFKGVEL